MLLPFNINKYNYRQLLFGLAVLIDCIVGGVELNYSATLLPQLTATNSEIPITNSEGTWIASVISLACLPGTILGCYLIEMIGRKWTYATVSISNCIGWCIIAASTEPWHLLLARTVHGVAIGISFPVCFCFMSEVTTTKYRSSFFNMINIGLALGMLITDILGTYSTWRITSYLLIPLSFFYFLIFLRLRNTYVWYLNRNRLEEARDAYFWYTKETVESISEYNRIVQDTKVITLKEVKSECVKPEFWKPLCIVSWFYGVVVFSGGNGIALYSVTVMKDIVTIDEYLTTIIIDVIRVFSTVTTTMLIKYFPIRYVVNICSVFCVMMLLTLSGALNWQSYWNGMHFLVLGSIFIFHICYNVGIVNISNISLGELLTGIAKPLGTCMAVMIYYGMNFILALIIPTMFADLGNAWSFFIFGICSAVGGFVLYFILPETKGISNMEIRNNFKISSQSNSLS